MNTQNKCPNCGASLLRDTLKCEYCGSVFEQSVATSQEVMTGTEKTQHNTGCANKLGFFFGIILALFSLFYVGENVVTNAIILILTGPIILPLLTFPLSNWFKPYQGVVHIVMGLITMWVYSFCFTSYLQSPITRSMGKQIIGFAGLIGIVMILYGIMSLIARPGKKSAN